MPWLPLIVPRPNSLDQSTSPTLTSWKKMLTCVLTRACEAWNLLHFSLKKKQLHLCSTTFDL
jgi:hypothetical protein